MSVIDIVFYSCTYSFYSFLAQTGLVSVELQLQQIRLAPRDIGNDKKDKSCWSVFHQYKWCMCNFWNEKPEKDNWMKYWNSISKEEVLGKSLACLVNHSCCAELHLLDLWLEKLFQFSFCSCFDSFFLDLNEAETWHELRDIARRVLCLIFLGWCQMFGKPKCIGFHNLVFSFNCS